MHLRPLLACVAALIVALASLAGAQQPTEAAAAASGGLELELAPDGTLTATGSLPPGLSAVALAAALPGIDLLSTKPSESEAQASWQPALDALSIVLPRFRTATIRLAPGELAIRGELRSGLSAAGAEAALRSALGAGWRLDLALAETAPPAEIVLTKAGKAISVSGLLPTGLAPSNAVERLGHEARDAGLAGGGAGSAEDWSQVFAALGETLDLFASANARVSAGQVAIQGVLRPGYPQPAVAERFGARLPPGWTAEVRAQETPASEGDRRVSLDTGQAESFRRGYWLPDVGFPVSVPRCRAEADAALADGGLPFAGGTAHIAASGEPLLNRLAAIAVRCLNSSSLRLEIGGHTDSVGNDARNQALSQARAEAVRAALVDRGVRADAVTARGYGENRPIASNNTPEGRAQNRRIAFDWSDPEG